MVANTLENGTKANNMGMVCMSMLVANKNMVNGSMERESDG